MSAFLYSKKDLTASQAEHITFDKLLPMRLTTMSKIVFTMKAIYFHAYNIDIDKGQTYGKTDHI